MSSGGRYFTYQINGRAVGVLELNGNNVELLVAHPGVSGCGAAMIECALANASGDPPTLSLEPAPAAVSAYKSLGFKGSQFEMALTPSEPKWVKQSGGRVASTFGSM